MIKQILRKLETNLKKTVDEIASVETLIRLKELLSDLKKETLIRNLKDAIWDKDAPNKVS